MPVVLPPTTPTNPPPATPMGQTMQNTVQHGMGYKAPPEMQVDQAKQMAQYAVDHSNGQPIPHLSSIDIALSKNNIIIPGYNSPSTTNNGTNQSIQPQQTPATTPTTPTLIQQKQILDTTPTLATTPTNPTLIGQAQTTKIVPQLSSPIIKYVNKPADIKVPSNAPDSVTKLMDQFKTQFPNGTPAGLVGGANSIAVMPDGTTRYASLGSTLPVQGATYYNFDGSVYKTPIASGANQSTQTQQTPATTPATSTPMTFLGTSPIPTASTTSIPATTPTTQSPFTNTRTLVGQGNTNPVNKPTAPFATSRPNISTFTRASPTSHPILSSGQNTGFNTLPSSIANGVNRSTTNNGISSNSPNTRQIMLANTKPTTPKPTLTVTNKKIVL
jgi:hypothetical protein